MRITAVGLPLCVFLGLMSMSQRMAADTSAGGKWIRSERIDKDTKNNSVFFFLEANKPVVEKLSSGKPTLFITCNGTGEDPKVDAFFLDTMVALGSPDGVAGLFHRPYKTVRLKMDDQEETYNWSFSTDSSTHFLQVPEAIRIDLFHAKTFQVEFVGSDGRSHLADFSPMGIDQRELQTQCGVSLTDLASTNDQDRQRAHETVMRFLQGIKIAALPEGKQLLADTQWIVGFADRGENFYSRPEYTEVNSIFASLFNTDRPLIKGYKELFEMKAVNRAGAISNLKYLVIAFKDKRGGAWKVMGSEDTSHSESDIDIDQQVAYFKNELSSTSDSARENYATYGKWLLMDGRIAEARTALTTASTASTQSLFGTGNDPIRDLQIHAMLEVIDRITK